jgi:pimeloyl-ACP methyl ester carboxylesterase
MGHSTGCQQIMRYLASEPKRSSIQKAILQAPGELTIHSTFPLSFLLSCYRGHSRSLFPAFFLLSARFVHSLRPRSSSRLPSLPPPPTHLRFPRRRTVRRWPARQARSRREDAFAANVTVHRAWSLACVG